MQPDFDPILGGILRADAAGVAVFVHDRSPLLGEALTRRWRRTLPDVSGRLVIVPRCEPDEYICLVASAHVVLDTPHFGGSNTAYDTFAVAVPAVTMPGEHPASRYTAGLCARMGIADAIGDSVPDYVARAVRWGTDPAARAEVVARTRSASAGIFESRDAVEQLEHFFAGVLANS